MAVWRTKAYELFDLKPGGYSYASGKRELFADLAVAAQRALHVDDADVLERIVADVT